MHRRSITIGPGSKDFGTMHDAQRPGDPPHREQSDQLPGTDRSRETEAIPSEVLEKFRFDSGSFSRMHEKQSPIPTAPKALPRRSKGRILTGTLLLTLLIASCYQIWNAFFRFASYGVVNGRLITVSAPVDGLVSYIHVTPGQLVHQGDLLVTIHSVELEHRLEQTADELRLAEASFSAEMTKLRWNRAESNHQNLEATAKFREAWSRYQYEMAQLVLKERQWQRAKKLRERDSISQAEYEQFRFEHEGQQGKVDQLRHSVKAWSGRAEVKHHLNDEGFEQLRPFITRIEILQKELLRIREELTLFEVRAPAPGVVIDQLHFGGEYASKSQPLVTILEENSLVVECYIPQQLSQNVELHDEVRFLMAPDSKQWVGKVIELGEEMVPAPATIKRHYRTDEKLLPVFLTPDPALMESRKLRIGSVVSIPWN